MENVCYSPKTKPALWVTKIERKMWSITSQEVHGHLFFAIDHNASSLTLYLYCPYHVVTCIQALIYTACTLSFMDSKLSEP